MLNSMKEVRAFTRCVHATLDANHAWIGFFCPVIFSLLSPVLIVAASCFVLVSFCLVCLLCFGSCCCARLFAASLLLSPCSSLPALPLLLLLFCVLCFASVLCRAASLLLLCFASLFVCLVARLSACALSVLCALAGGWGPAACVLCYVLCSL